MKQALRRILTRKYFLIPMAVLCLYSLVGFFLAPWITGWYAPKFVKEQFQCRLDMGKVRINPFLLTFEANDVSLSTPEEPLAGFKRLFVDFEITRLFTGAATFREIRLEKPTVHVTVHPDGGINLEKFSPKPPEAGPSDSKPLRMLIDSGLVSGGTIIITDNRQSRPASVNLQKLDLNATNVSTLPDHNGTCTISARTPDGEAFQCQGKIALTPFAASGKLSFSAVQAATLWQFMKDSLDLESVSGKLDMSTDYRVETGNLPTQLQLDNLHFDFLDLSLKLSREEKAFFALKKMDMDQVRFNLTEKQLQVGKLLIAGGAVNLRIDEAGSINFAQIVRKDPKINTVTDQTVEPPLESSAAPVAPTAPPALPWSANAGSIEIRDIAFDFDNFSRATPVSYGVSSIGINFAAKIQTGSQEIKVLLKNISSELKDARIQLIEATQPIFQTDKLTIEGGMLDLDAHSLTVSRIGMHGGTLDVLRDSKGQINWQPLFEPKKSAVETSVPAAVKKLQPYWKFLIKSFEVDGFGSNLSDIGTVPDRPILNIQSFSCRLTDVDGKSPMDFETGFSLKQGGTVAVHGKVDPATPSVEANLDLKSLSLAPLQPYLKTVAAATLKSADVSLLGNLKYGVKSAGAKIAYSGSASLDKLLITETNVQKPLIGWDSLSIPQVSLTLQPDKLNIEKIRLSKPIGEVIIGQDHILNLSRVFKTQAGQKKPKASPEPDSKKGIETFPVRVGKVEIEKGDMLFADLSLRPQFMTRITELKGEVSALASAGDSPSEVKLDGRVDEYGLAKISGKINVFHPEISTDLSLVFRNVEMTKLTPYSGKFAGRRITSGKLSTDLKYRIQDGKLLGDNQIIVDNLTLGEHVDSPDAVNLPLDLAIALLKDSSGRIDIGLPVSGDLNDPQFSYGHLIWKALVNLLTKIVTSPFRALGSVFGGGDEPRVIMEFDPGSSELLPPEREKLQKMADVLKNRPQLKLSVLGHYSPDADGAELKAQSLRQAIAGRSGTKGGEKEDLGAVDFTAPNIQQALKKLFSEKAGAPAFDALKQPIEKETKNKADIPRVLAESLYSKLLETEPVSAEKLSMLAEDRAREIVKELETAGIPADRLALKSPEPQTSGPPSASFSLDAMTAS
jgi:uncharacterized protein involved in outer membrane biogenesis